jgi:Family of unknown function (DUF5719)
MRWFAVLVIAALAAAVTVLPERSPQGLDDAPARVRPPVATCPLVEEGDRTTALSVVSSVDGPGRLSGFAAGSIVGEQDFSTGVTGSVTISAVDVGAVGDATGGLVEMPSEATSAGVVVQGPSSLAAEACEDVVTDEAFVSGGSTTNSEDFELQILNPFAGNAIVDLTVTTDAGIESDDRFDSVVVPASSVKTLDFGEIVPGRSFISVDLDTTQGAVLAVARQTSGDELAIWRAVEPAQEWWLPVPPGGDTKELLLSTPANTEIEYQIDLYGPGGLVEEYQGAGQSASLPAHGVARVSLTADTTDAVGVRVFSTGPVVPTLWMQSDSGLAVTTASEVQATTWLLPGAGVRPGGSAAAVILNAGVDPADVAVRSIREDSVVTDFSVGPESTIVVNLVNADGYRVESTNPVVVLWVANVPGAGSASIGIPIEDE